MFAGLLFIIKATLDVLVGPPPLSEAQVMAWVSTHRSLMATTNEVHFIGALLLVSAPLSLFSKLAGQNAPVAASGSVAMVLAAIISLFSAIVYGRLAYPIFGMDLSTSTATLVLSLYYGGLHAVSLLLMVSMIPFALTMGRCRSLKRIAPFTLGAGALQVLGAYPWIFGIGITSLMNALFGTWLIVVGVALLPAGISRNP